MNHLIKSSLARQASTLSAQGSATVTGSLPSQSAANSAGASTNLAEISQTLDSLLNKLSESERLSIGEENVANRLQRLCERYPQSQIPVGLPEWQHDQTTMDMVRLAADCAEAVYDRKQKTIIPGLTLPTSDFELVEEIAATSTGDFKATSLRVHRLNRTLVIAIRGTKKTSPIDWITNSNGEPSDASSFLPGVPGIKAHAGFLYVAQNLAETIHDAIRSYTGPVNSILFTGHSAGGAVATLLCLSFQLKHTLDVPLHCITFAAPPTVSMPNIASVIGGTVHSSQHTASHFLAFAAHGDLVVRADRPYVRQVLEIYSSSDSVPPVPDFQFDPAELWNAGTAIVLFDKNMDSGDEEIHAVEAAQGLGEFLWGNLHVHSMKVYLELLSGL